MKERIEKDSLGAVKIPGSAYWGKETQRAMGVFQVSGEPMPLLCRRPYRFLELAQV